MIPLGVLASARRAAGGVVPTYRGNAFKVAPVGGAPATYTYASAPIGAASGTREVIAVVLGWSGGSRSVNSATIGGISATYDYYSGATASHFAVFRASVPTGTTADVVVTCSDNTIQLTIAVWTVDVPVAVNASGFVTINSGVTAGTVSTVSVASDALGFVLSGHHARSNILNSTWSGHAVEVFDNVAAQPSSAAVALGVGGTANMSIQFDAAVTNAPIRLGAIAYKPA